MRDEPYVYQNGEVYRPSIKPEQLREIGTRARPRRNLGEAFRERARLARERREAEGDNQ